MTTHAFIFARGGSKGLPRKNVKNLNGKPMICYSIEVAKQLPFIKSIFVSTEDAEIAEVAAKAGAIVINRPTELASDESPEWLSWQHGVQWVRDNYGNFDEFVSLPVTSPLRSVEDIENAVLKMRDTQADVCISVAHANRSPFFNMVKIVDGEFVELVNKARTDIYRRQDAPEVFDITTVVYATSPSFIMNNEKLFDGNVTSIEVPKVRAVDIDDIYDFRLAEVILSEEKKKHAD